MTAFEQFSITFLSAFVSPPGTALMAAFKGYFDESGKEDDPQFACSAISVGGYITTVDSWRDIEAKWKAVLDRPEFGVRYLHMKEFAHFEGQFASWRGDESRRKALIESLSHVIRESDLAGVGSIVRLPDLWRFNREYGLCLHAYPLGIYGCLIELSRRYGESCIETVWDKVDRHTKQIAIAREYAETDISNPGCGANVEINPLEKCFSSKDFPALQIADFAAYELLKSHRDKNDWFLNEEPFLHPSQWFKSQFDRWHSKTMSERPMEGRTWTLNTMIRVHVLRRGIWSESALAARSS